MLTGNDLARAERLAFQQRTESYPSAAQEYYLRTLWRGINYLQVPQRWGAYAMKLSACPQLPEVL